MYQNTSKSTKNAKVSRIVLKADTDDSSMSKLHLQNSPASHKGQ